MQKGPSTTSGEPFAAEGTSAVVSGASLLVVKGRTAIVALQPMLEELTGRWEQPGAASYVEYFLTQPYTGGKMPNLCLLLRSQVASRERLDPREVVAAVLLHEYRSAGVPLGIFVTEDFAGERNVLAPAEIRSAAALRVVDQMLGRGAHVVVVSLREACFGDGASLAGAGAGHVRAMWSVVERRLTRRLPLAKSLDATLASLGSHTRRNLRYYRRRAEQQLGCSFVARADIAEEDFIALNRLCSYPTPDFVAHWRYRTARSLPGGIFAGILAADGAWLSIVGGRRCAGTTSIDWQMNRRGLASSSLSTVMRSYLMEHEIAAGSETLLFEGGTPHSMQLSFPPDRVSDLVVVRGTLRGSLVRRLGVALLPKANFLAKVLGASGASWRHWQA